MKQLSIFLAKINDKIIAVTISVMVFFMAYPAYADGLDKAKKALGDLKTGIGNIISIVATIILLCLAIGYAGRFIEKNTFIRWAIGVIIAGSAAQITELFVSKA